MRAILLAVLLASPAGAEVFESVTSGIICATDTGESTPAPETSQGSIDLIYDDAHVAAETLKIPAVLGLRFGVIAQLPSDTAGFDGEMTVTHPPFKGQTRTTERWQTQHSPGSQSIAAFTFDFDHEVVPGLWTFEATRGSEVLYRVEFTVIPATGKIDLCSGELLS